MATLVVDRPDLFPPSTSVAAYARSVFGVPASGAPYGSAVETESVAGDGTLTLNELEDDTRYVLYASSPDRYLNVTTFTASSGGGGGGLSEAEVQALIDAAIATHSADTTGVHGISDTAFIKGVVVDVAGGAEVRPDFLSVEFIQLDDPDAIADDDGDTWVPTGEG